MGKRFERGEQGYLNRQYEIPRSGPESGGKWRSRYHFLSEELTFLDQMNDRVFYTDVFDLSVARPPSNPLIINEAGRGIIIFGITTATIYDPVANTGIEVVANTIMMAAKLNVKSSGSTGVGVSSGDNHDLIVLKHGRGFMGEFKGVSLTWPAQASNSARVCIWKWDGNPYFSGDFPA